MKRLNVPVLKAQVGDWMVYLGSIRMGDLAERVKRVPESPYPHWRERLDAWAMAAAPSRERTAPEFLFARIFEPHREPLIVACLAGDCFYKPIDAVSDDDLEEDTEIPVEGKLGILIFSGGEEECLVAYGGGDRLLQIRRELAQGEPDREQVVLFFDGRMGIGGADATP